MAEVDFSGRTLLGCNFDGRNWVGSNFGETILAIVSLVSARLQGISFENAVWTNVKATRADFWSACFGPANFRTAALHNGNLSRADLQNADITEASTLRPQT